MRAAFFSHLLLLVCLAGYAAGAPQSIEFNRDVRPILADHCFACHGPDAQQRKADLRLDTPEAADPKRENGAVVVAGQLAKSELWRRVTSSDRDEQMPPPNKGRRLNDGEIAILKQWITQGAKFEKHWSLLPVRRPSLPEVKLQNATKSPLDTFTIARLEREGLAPLPEADRATLLRRATLGLTGLPPTPDEIDTFLNDRPPDAYERAVDRLLTSPRHGERMAIPWLDAARYADTSGYQSDGERFMWRWRDWVIEALNSNMPFDQFTIEQLAGDLLPKPTLDQRIATGFNRNHRGNSEGGIIPEEYAVEYVADRVETTATVWLGLTLGCARCHDHKYDPFTQRDFYSLFAFFNNVSEKGRAIKIGNSPPYIAAPTRIQTDELLRLKKSENEAYVKLHSTHRAEIVRSYFEWERSAKEKTLGDWYPVEGLVAHLPLDGDLIEQSSREPAKAKGDDLQFTRGKLRQAGQFVGNGWIESASSGNFGFFDKFTLSTWIRIEQATDGGTLVSRMIDEPQAEGYQLAFVGGKLQFNLSKRWLDDALRVETADALSIGTWHHIAATYDGSRVADGVRLYIDGESQKLTVLLDELNQSFATKEPLRIGAGGGRQMRFRGLIDEVRIYSTVLSSKAVRILATSQTLDEILADRAPERNLGSGLKLYAAFTEKFAPSELRAMFREHELAKQALSEFEEKLPTVMVMEEMPEPRETHILLRGQYDKPGERVEPTTPAQFPPLSAGATAGLSSSVRPNRLDLAQWLVDRSNPLTSRVLVNRIWQLHFGIGIVKTSEDFGLQGEWPSHPELLDWLASEFASDWDIKRLQRTIVTSATFRQSSAATNPNDPENRLLSRGPRLRLSAEMVRDQALFASGLLVEQVGGASVKPLQPAGLWSELTGGDDYQPGQGADLVRRSLYTFWKRTIPPPTLSAFDSPSREACVVRQSRTNTPLQALTLLNEPTFVAAAKGLAERAIGEANSPAERIERAMLHAGGRRPTSDELRILSAALRRYEQQLSETEAMALVCSTILNLDEAVTGQ
jgi:mono/diheme cytochrome c family protein